MKPLDADDRRKRLADELCKSPQLAGVADPRAVPPDPIPKHGGWGQEDDLDSVRALHDSYVGRYQHDSDRTWSSATWLVGVAWTLFPAALALNPSLNLPLLLGFAAASMALVGLWLVIAQWHVAWASRSYDIVRATEMVLLGSNVEIEMREELKGNHPGPKGWGDFPMRRLRNAIFVGTAVAWMVLGGIGFYDLVDFTAASIQDLEQRVSQLEGRG